METCTLAQLRAEARHLSDNDGATLRHTDADVTRRVNVAIRAYRARVTSNGLPYFITETDAATLAGTVPAGERYSEVPWPEGPPDAVQILGVEVASDTTADDWYPLQPVTWAARSRVARGAAAAQWFAIRRVPQTDPDDLDAVLPGALAIFPGQESGAYRVSYLPDLVDLAADGDLFVALPEGVQWVVQSVVMDLTQRDDDQHETYAIAAQRFAAADQAILDAAARVQSAGPILPRRAGRGWGRGPGRFR